MQQLTLEQKIDFLNYAITNFHKYADYAKNKQYYVHGFCAEIEYFLQDRKINIETRYPIYSFPELVESKPKTAADHEWFKWNYKGFMSRIDICYKLLRLLYASH